MAVDIGYLPIVDITNQVLQACNSATTNSQVADHVVHVIAVLFEEEAACNVQDLVGEFTLDPHFVFGLIDLFLLLLFIQFSCLFKSIFDLLRLEDSRQLAHVDNPLLLAHQLYFRLMQL